LQTLYDYVDRESSGKYQTGDPGKDAMKHRSIQLGARKNPDSPRVHGLRLTATKRIARIAEPVTETKTEPIDFSMAEPYVSGESPFEERTN
jgi:hypothetical protein